MNDIQNPHLPVGGDVQVRPAPRHRASFSDGMEAQRRARAFEQPQSESERKGIDRLDRILKSGNPLSGDMPRGYYLDIVI